MTLYDFFDGSGPLFVLGAFNILFGTCMYKLGRVHGDVEREMWKFTEKAHRRMLADFEDKLSDAYARRDEPHAPPHTSTCEWRNHAWHCYSTCKYAKWKTELAKVLTLPGPKTKHPDDPS